MKFEVNPIRCMINARLKTVGLGNFGFFAMLEGEGVEMKRFPVLLTHWERDQYEDCPESIPWELIEPHEWQARRNHYQSLERLAERGGLSPDELVAVMEGRGWRPMTMRDAVNRLKYILGW